MARVDGCFVCMRDLTGTDGLTLGVCYELAGCFTGPNGNKERGEEQRSGSKTALPGRRAPTTGVSRDFGYNRLRMGGRTWPLLLRSCMDMCTIWRHCGVLAAMGCLPRSLRARVDIAQMIPSLFGRTSPHPLRRTTGTSSAGTGRPGRGVYGPRVARGPQFDVSTPVGYRKRAQACHLFGSLL